MKKINFLIKLKKKGKIKLKKKGKIKLVEPSEEIKESYVNKSDNSLKSAKILLKNGQVNDSIPLAYYSMYHIATALLYKVGIKCENHSATIMLLKELFNLDNSKINFAKTERIDKQYYVDFIVTEKDATDLIKIANEFNLMLYEFIDRLTNKKARDYRQELKISLN